MLFWAAAILFFFAAVGVNIIPHPQAWGLFALALGLALGGPAWGWWRRGAVK